MLKASTCSTFALKNCLMKLIPIFLLFFLCGYAQEPNKSYTDWYQKAIKNSRIHNDSLLFYSKKMQSSANSDCEYINGLTFEANAIYFKRDCNASKKLSEKNLKKITKHASSLTDSCFYHLKARNLGRLLYAEKCLGNYTKALNYITENQNLNNKYKKYSSSYTVQILYQSALIYVALEKYTEAVEQFRILVLKLEQKKNKKKKLTY